MPEAVPCPRCGSAQTRHRPQRDDWFCDGCDHRWPVAPATGPRARLFLSYGRRDATDLANRLREDLEKHGYQVWQDTREIRASAEWELQIRDGLRSTQLVAALLSPHAVRRASDPASPDGIESVCLDEISYARFGRPPRPIVPVMAVPCEPPFCIFRLDYVDLCCWRESPEQYRRGFERLLAAIEAALRGEVRYRPWEAQLQPWDFAAFLNEKRRDFCGREWLFDEIEAWRVCTAEPALLITGEPGAGKSAVVAELVHRNPGGQVLAYHCCQADTPATLAPGRFVRSVAAMIASKLPAYADLLDRPAVAEALGEASCDRDPASAFEAGVLTALESLPAPPEGVRYLLVDALDEALAVEGGPCRATIVEVLASRLERLPGWLRVVATTRKERAVLDRLRGLRARELATHDQRNLDDLARYLDRRLTGPNLAERLARAGRSPAEVADLLRRRSAGNFLYVQQALLGLERDLYDLDRLDSLPPGLHGLYLRSFGRQFPDEPAYAPIRAVLEVLVAAREALTEEELAGATCLAGDDDLPRALRGLAPYLSEQDGRFALITSHSPTGSPTRRSAAACTPSAAAAVTSASRPACSASTSAAWSRRPRWPSVICSTMPFAVAMRPRSGACWRTALTWPAASRRAAPAI